MTRRFWLVAIALFSALTISVARAAEDAASRAASLGVVAQSISQQIQAERATCEAMLDEGVNLGLWNDDEKRAGEDLLAYIFTNVPESNPRPRMMSWGFRFESNTLLPVVTRSVNPASATQPVFLWLKTRITALETTRNQVMWTSLHTTMEEAEKVWLSAKNPSDLEPALLGMMEAKALLGFKWGQLSFHNAYSMPDRLPSSSWLGTSDLTDFAWALRDFWSIMGPPEPLLLPDPTTDPAGFAGTRVKWLALQRGNFGKNQLLRRPEVARRFVEFDDRFRAEFAEIQRTLDDAILQDAPSAEFESQFLRLQRYVVPATPANRGPGPYFPPPNPNSDNPPDYRERLRPSPGAPPVGLSPDTVLRWSGNYAGWLEWRKAREQGNTAQADKTRAALLSKVSDFRPHVADYLRKRLVTPPKRPAMPVPSIDETNVAGHGSGADLVSALRKFASENPELNISELILAWGKFDPANAQATATEFQFASVWSLIAGTPGGRTLLELRDRVARETLAGLIPDLSNPNDAPLAALFQRALEISTTRDQSEVVAKIAELDRIGVALLESDRASWQRTIEAWKSAKKRPAARSGWLQLLRETTSHAAAVLAAQKIKALPAKSE